MLLKNPASVLYFWNLQAHNAKAFLTFWFGFSWCRIMVRFALKAKFQIHKAGKTHLVVFCVLCPVMSFLFLCTPPQYLRLFFCFGFDLVWHCCYLNTTDCILFNLEKIICITLCRRCCWQLCIILMPIFTSYHQDVLIYFLFGYIWSVIELFWTKMLCNCSTDFYPIT